MSTPHTSLSINANAVMQTGSIRLTLCGRNWTLLRPTDLETLWESIDDEEFGADERLPYWVELWPASLALAVWLNRNRSRIAGRRCLDLGCGLGFTALFGVWLGARVLAMDYEAEALAFARKNAAANALPDPLWTLMDWRRPAVTPKSCDFIWGGDVMYEKRFVDPVMAFLDHALADGGVAWMAEPGREAYDDFKRALLSRGWRSSRIAQERVTPLHVQNTPVTVNLWELTRGNTFL